MELIGLHGKEFGTGISHESDSRAVYVHQAPGFGIGNQHGIPGVLEKQVVLVGIFVGGTVPVSAGSIASGRRCGAPGTRRFLVPGRVILGLGPGAHA